MTENSGGDTTERFNLHNGDISEDEVSKLPEML